jgi:hypothetical protein
MDVCYAKYHPLTLCQCFFPREVIKDIHTPVFVLNPAYDAWQVLSSVPSEIFYYWIKLSIFKFNTVMCYFRYSMCWHQKHRTLNVHGKTVGWILASVILTNLRFSKVTLHLFTDRAHLALIIQLTTCLLGFVYMFCYVKSNPCRF